jgi:hypothetical protein
MSTTAPKPVTTPIPVQLSEPEFEAFLLPHLSMPSCGLQCKLGSHRVFNLILWLLYTEMQWKCLPVPTDTNGKPVIHDTTVYKVFARWADEGRSGRRLWPVCGTWRQRNTSTPVCSVATGPTPWPKRGGCHRVLRVQTPEGRESHRDHGQPWLRLGAGPRGSYE